MNAFLSIDWDWFVPENPLHDFAHTENSYFLDNVWMARGVAFKEMRTNGLEHGFWDRVSKARFNRVPHQISDSHVDVWENPYLHRVDTLVLVDRHHDAYSLPDKDSFHCGNWVIPWLERKAERRVIWVTPPDVISTHVHNVEDRFDVCPDFDFASLNYTGIHICRSGCWTPPWLDAAFVRFVNAARPHRSIAVTRQEWTNPMVPRWTLTNYRSMFKMLTTWRSLKETVEAGGRFVL